MRGVSRTSLAEVSTRFDQVVASADATTIATLAEGLREVTHLLDREHTLRRAASDPALRRERRAGLLRALLEGKVSAETLTLVQDAVRERWSRSRDLPDALERLAVVAEVTVAERAGQLDDVEDELFRFGRIVDGQPDLRSALTNPQAPAEPKRRLLHELLDGKVTEVSLRLISEVVVHPRGRSLDRGLEEYARIAAERRQRLIAVVRTATALGAAQRDRLAGALSAMYDRDIHLNIEIDPQVIGGMSIQVGDEVIDGTVLARLTDVRRRLAG